MKNALLISPPFFHYEDHIKLELEKRGYCVHYVNHRKGKFIDAICSFLPLKKQRKVYYDVLMKRLTKFSVCKIDLLLVVKGEFLTEEHILYMRRENPQIRCIMYQWDSVSNFDYLKLIPYFDNVFTFDLKDSQSYSLKYLPLFYTNDIKITSKVVEDIDLLLIGTFNPLRYKYYLRLKSLAKENHLKLYAYIFTPLSFYIKNQILKNNLHIKSVFDIRFFPMRRSDLIKYYSRAKVVVDVCRANQTGLSMRMIESYGMNKKTLTSNVSIDADPVVREICYLNTEESDSAILDFINRPVKKYIDRNKLSLICWMDTLLE